MPGQDIRTIGKGQELPTAERELGDECVGPRVTLGGAEFRGAIEQFSGPCRPSLTQPRPIPITAIKPAARDLTMNPS